LKNELLKKVRCKEAKIGIIGLGYVGLPLAIEFCSSGFSTYGFDLDEAKINSLRKGDSYIKHIPSNKIVAISKRFFPTNDFTQLAVADCLIICVPTPLTKHREPDMRYVFGTARSIAQHLRKGQLVSLESTTYPGTTSKDIREILEATGLKAGKDFFLAYSPEREDPSNEHFSTSTIPKLVGGYSKDCLEVANAVYASVVKKTVPVSSTDVAEAAKLLENIYRSVNIALVNELKMLFDRMGINIWEVIGAAATKPFGFQAFYPGPGLGGHCIPIDPFYLTWKAREYNFSTRFIELAGEINTMMPEYVVQKVIEALNAKGTSVLGARVLVLGVAYKKNVDDLRESPSLRLMELLVAKGVHVDYSDPYFTYLPPMRKYRFSQESVPLTPQNLQSYDCVLLATDHDLFDYTKIKEFSRLIVDTRGRYPCEDKVVQA